MLKSMTWPVRIEFERALYHVTSRGYRREAIYEDDADGERFLEILGEASPFGEVMALVARRAFALGSGR